MKTSKRILCLMLSVVFCLSLFATTASASSYPSMYPKQYTYNVIQGRTLDIVFTLFHEFKNEKAHVRIHQGSDTGPVVATADRDFYNVNSMTNYTLSWDTKDVQPGKYVVEYWMSFYTLYNWYETPNHKTLLTINVTEDPNRMVTLYAEGKSKMFPASQVAAQLAVGWYKQPVQRLYTEGKSKLFFTKDVAAQLAVGWYTEPVQRLYSEGKSKLFKKSQVAAQLKVGWYTEPVQRLYAAGGKSKLFKKSQVAAQLKVGWYTTPVK